MTDPGPQIAQRLVTFPLLDGKVLTTDERYFIVRVPSTTLIEIGWSGAERQYIKAHRWWTAAALAKTEEQIWPNDVTAMLSSAGIWPPTGSGTA